MYLSIEIKRNMAINAKYKVIHQIIIVVIIYIRFRKFDKFVIIKRKRGTGYVYEISTNKRVKGKCI